MKKLLCMVLCLLVLAGCAAAGPEQTTAATEPPQPESPSLVEQGIPWDREGTLLEIPLTVPQGWKYSNMLWFGERMLLWYTDIHLENKGVMGLCLVDLTTGQVAAREEFPVGGSFTPQVLKDSVYLCDNMGGKVTQLGENLQVLHQWQYPSDEGSWFVDENHTLYTFTGEQILMAADLSTGESAALLPQASQVFPAGAVGPSAALEYYDDTTGAVCYGLLDLHTGKLETAPFDGRFSGLSRAGDYWLCTLHNGGYYFGMNDRPFRIRAEDGQLLLLQDGRLLEMPYDGQYLRLYDTGGNLLSQCCLSETGSCYAETQLHWLEQAGGYFFRMWDDSGSTRLMFWDVSKGAEGEDLYLEAVPEPSQAQQVLREKADAMEQRYGLTILLGAECATEFNSFTALQVDDYETVSTALDTLDAALSQYPEGFFRQLRYGNVQGIEIQLVGELTATDDQRLNGSYSAFVEEQWDKNLMVADVYTCYESSYYHEVSHIIDNFLFWDSCQRSGAVFSEEGWMALNPVGFDYAYDYAAEFESFLTAEQENFFIDTYSTVSPTEDRARVMEYAMMEHSGWVFDEKEGMLNKLEYYSQCIRDAFDTTLWPQILPWEQYLN